MRSWIDANGKEWVINLTIGKMKEIKDELELDLLENPLDPSLEDIVSVININYILVRGQHEVGPQDFGEALTTEVLEQMLDCFWKEYADFFLVARPAWGIAILAGQIESGARNLERLFEVIQIIGDNVSNWEALLTKTHEATRSESSSSSQKGSSRPQNPLDLLKELGEVPVG